MCVCVCNVFLCAFTLGLRVCVCVYVCKSVCVYVCVCDVLSYLLILLNYHLFFMFIDLLINIYNC